VLGFVGGRWSAVVSQRSGLASGPQAERGVSYRRRHTDCTEKLRKDQAQGKSPQFVSELYRLRAIVGQYRTLAVRGCRQEGLEPGKIIRVPPGGRLGLYGKTMSLRLYDEIDFMPSLDAPEVKARFRPPGVQYSEKILRHVRLEKGTKERLFRRRRERLDSRQIRAKARVGHVHLGGFD
jgi:hypothetical protein